MDSEPQSTICCSIPASINLFISKHWREYKKQSLAVLFFLLEAISFMLDQFGGSQLGFHIASLVLSALSFMITICSAWITKTRITSSITNKSGAGMQNIAVEVVFSFIQLIITSVCLIRTLSGVKTDNNASFYPLAYSVITVVFTFLSNEEVSDSTEIPLDTHIIQIDPEVLDSSNPHIVPLETEVSDSSDPHNIRPLNTPPTVVIGNGESTDHSSAVINDQVVPSNTPTVESVPSSSASNDIQGVRSTLRQRIISKKAVFKVDLSDDRDKRKAMKVVSSISGVESIQTDMKDRKLTVIGNVDPVAIVTKMRKLWHTEILSVELANEPGPLSLHLLEPENNVIN